MKTSSRSIFMVLGLGISAALVSGCAGKHGHGMGGKMTKAGEAVLESKQTATVRGTVVLEDHYGGLLASGKIAGMRSDRSYKLVLTDKGDCSARNASSAGAILVEINKDGDSAIGKNGTVAGHAKGKDLKAAMGKAVVVIATDDEKKMDYRVACGTVKETMKGAQCSDCGMKNCKCDGKDCKCDKSKKMKSKAETESLPRERTADTDNHRRNDPRTHKVPTTDSVY